MRLPAFVLAAFQLACSINPRSTAPMTADSIPETEIQHELQSLNTAADALPVLLGLAGGAAGLAAGAFIGCQLGIPSGGEDPGLDGCAGGAFIGLLGGAVGGAVIGANLAGKQRRAEAIRRIRDRRAGAR